MVFQFIGIPPLYLYPGAPTVVIGSHLHPGPTVVVIDRALHPCAAVVVPDGRGNIGNRDRDGSDSGIIRRVSAAGRCFSVVYNKRLVASSKIRGHIGKLRCIGAGIKCMGGRVAIELPCQCA